MIASHLKLKTIQTTLIIQLDLFVWRLKQFSNIFCSSIADEPNGKKYKKNTFNQQI